ncbi:MAG: OmpA family protein [Bacteroidetes bacterium]|nr:OmpA family protein [Bacteroidota bacterium]
MHVSASYPIPVLTFLVFCSIFAQAIQAQSTLDAYVFESNNRGFLQQAFVTVYSFPDNTVIAELRSDTLGHFSLPLPRGKYRIFTRKDVFYDRQDTLDLNSDKVFVKIEMQRKPGYLFDISLAEARDNSDQVVDAIQGATIEIYNRTQNKADIVLKNHPNAFFQHTFEQGNHYTMLLRKPGYLAKRIEIYVNVKGCILCVDGVRDLSPGISDNLTAGNTMGTLVANVELVKAKVNKRIRVNNIYYDFDKWDIRPDAEEQLDKIVTLMNDNPSLRVELGSHTDSRGNDAYNLTLSERRAAAAVAYIVSEGIDSSRILAKGYGETELVNGCKNDVPCSEEAHQQNRRTELRILGIGAEALDWIPLAQIVAKENTEQAAKNTRKQAKITTEKPKQQTKEPVAGELAAPVDPLAYEQQQRNRIPKMNPLPKNYMGYAIELRCAGKELPADFPDFRGNEQVFQENTEKNGFCYYLPLAGNELQAKKQFQQIKQNHRGAQLVLFDRKGKNYLP